MQKIKSWKDIIRNVDEFELVIDKQNNTAFKRFTSFFHWNYFPDRKLFAPSKFIGYQETTAKNYKGFGSGGETQEALTKYFTKIEKGSSKYKGLSSELNKFSLRLGKKINKKTFEGTGGIYYPKSQYLNSKYHIDPKLLLKVKADLNSLENEEEKELEEGGKKQRLVNYYERSSTARATAITYHGLTCKVCKFNFEERYGQHGAYFIEVHHLIPISNIDKKKKIDFKNDMTVLCSNFHRMIHRDKNNPLTIEQLKNLLRSNGT